MNLDQARRPLKIAAALLLTYLIAYVGIWQWVVCRVEVPPGSSLQIRYKGPWPFGRTTQAPEGTLVQVDQRGRPLQVGVLEAMPGPGRHFYSPLEYELKIIPDLVIPPGKLGVVLAKFGKQVPNGNYLTDEPGYRGIRRKVLTPGRYRMNEYAYEINVVDVDACVEPSTKVEHAEGSAMLIPPGYVGVVTNKFDDPRTRKVQGIQDQVLQPGIYFLNPVEKRVDIVSVGFAETSLTVEPESGGKLQSETPRRDSNGQLTLEDPIYAAGKGIEFPSNDGFLIHLDFTAIWGVTPGQAPDIVRQFGKLSDVEQKVILPQIGSICRLYGSKRGAVDLLVGNTREAFQNETSGELERVLAAKSISLLFGLTRHIYVPAQVREPIQLAKIADELTKTRDQEQITAKAEADLTEAKAKVLLEERRTLASTAKQVAELEASGEKQAKEIEATTEKLIAEIDAKTAEFAAETTTTLGEASAKSIELTREAEADRFRQYVKALGGSDSYNRFVFAEGLPSNLRLGVFYAGPGTFWTDLKGIEQTLLGKLASEANPPKASSTAAPSVPPSATGMVVPRP